MNHIYLCHILSMQPPVGLCPFYFTRIPLHLEVLVAFRSTEPKNLPKEHYLGSSGTTVGGIKHFFDEQTIIYKKCQSKKEGAHPRYTRHIQRMPK